MKGLEAAEVVHLDRRNHHASWSDGDVPLKFRLEQVSCLCQKIGAYAHGRAFLNYIQMRSTWLIFFSCADA